MAVFAFPKRSKVLLVFLIHADLLQCAQQHEVFHFDTLCKTVYIIESAFTLSFLA